MEKTTLYLPTDLQRGLKELSRRSGRAQASLIREALERYLAGQDRPRPASIGAANDGTLDATESEAWIRREWRRGSAPPRSTKAPKSDRKSTASRA